MPPLFYPFFCFRSHAPLMSWPLYFILPCYHFPLISYLQLTIKYGFFCQKYYLVPLDIKLQVFNTYVPASLLYSCETWGDSNFKQIESLSRQGLKTALDVGICVNNKTVHAKSDDFPLDVRIMKHQLKFWITLQEYIHQNPDHYMHILINVATYFPYT